MPSIRAIPDPYCQARKKSTKINFLGLETARWGGGLPLEGVVAENFVPALESLSSLGFEERNLGCPGIFAGMSRTPGRVQKVCAKKLRAHFSFPILGNQQYSWTALGHLRVRFGKKPMGLFPEAFWKPIGRANSTRGQPYTGRMPCFLASTSMGP